MVDELTFSEILIELQKISSQNSNIVTICDDILKQFETITGQNDDIINNLQLINQYQTVNLFIVALLGLLIGLSFVLIFKRK